MSERGAEREGSSGAGGVQSIDRAVAILSTFSRARPVAGISEIARHTGLTRGTTHRLVMALVSHGLMTQVPETTAYSLGPRLLNLADVAREHLSLEIQAKPVMTWLRDRTGETVGLHVLDEEPSRRTIAQVESHHPLRRTYTDLGAAREPHLGAPGKALLAFTTDDRLDAARARLEAQGGAVDELDERLAEVRANGYAISLQERIAGVVAVAMPVFDHSGLAGALSVSVPAARAGREELVGFTGALREAAELLSTRLGGSSAGTSVS